MDQITSGLRKLILAGIGAAAIAKEKGGEVLELLSKRGEVTVEQGKVMNEELKRNIRDKVKENVTVVVKDDEPSVDKVVETMDKMSPEELQAIKDKLARMERENAEDAEVKDAE